jgi:flavin-binding protein dodecin
MVLFRQKSSFTQVGVICGDEERPFGYSYSKKWRWIVAESVYKIVELVGTSTESWEKAATAAVERASQTLRDLRIAEVVQLDMQIEDGKVMHYRAKLKVSFKFEG